MSSTLCIRKTPKHDTNTIRFKIPLKDIINKRFGLEGSSSKVIIGPSERNLQWFKDVLDGMNFAQEDKKDILDLNKIINILEEGDSIDVWFEY